MALRKGMWVKLNGKVGILDRLQNHACEVHMVNDKGETEFVALANEDQLTQCNFSDIPKARRPPPDFAAKLGYH